MNSMNRRRVLRGVLGGSAVTVALPLLNCYLNGNGNALASGKPMPVRFGTWVWGLGINKVLFSPKKAGLNYDIASADEIAGLAPIQKDMNLFTNYTSYRDSAQNFDHYSGWITTRSGSAPKQRTERPGETIDVTVANRIGRTTRFKMLTATATGDVRNSLSYEGQTSLVPAEFSPVKFYTRLFGPGFQNPNAAEFVPDPRAMVRKSVLSGVMDDIKDLERNAGGDDKIRLEQYFSGLRDLERQLDIQLTKPEPIEACKPSAVPKKDPAVGVETGVLATRHNLMTDLLVMAAACDQTRVLNMFYTGAAAVSIKAGYEKPHHTISHEEALNEQGFQPMVSWFTKVAMESWMYYVQAFQKVKEGDGTLLDNSLLMAHSDQGFAKIHSLDGMAMFLAGRAGGKIKTGYHLPGNGATVTKVGYTALRAMGIEERQWGTQSNTTSEVISEIWA